VEGLEIKKDMKKISYGNWQKVKFNFVRDFYKFKEFLYRKDFTLAGMVLKDFRNHIEILTRVLEKMEEEYELKRKKHLRERLETILK